MAVTYTPSELITARENVQGVVHQTPVLTCQQLDEMAGAQLFFKCENFQRGGSFKLRGATNAAAQLSEESLSKGLTTHSSGNFAQALALTARQKGVPAHIVMPENAPLVKQNAVAQYGAHIIHCTPTLQARESTVEQVITKTGATFIHPYDDPYIIAGQSTCCQELLVQIGGVSKRAPEQATQKQSTPAKLDAIICPVGGGGLIAGTLLAAHHFSPSTKVYGAEPTGADDAIKSLKAGHIIPSTSPKTICDGLLTSLGKHTFPVIQQHVSDIMPAEETEIIQAMKLIWERMKIVVEPSSAITLAVLLKHKHLFEGQRIGLILSGGNVDLGALPF